LVKRADDFPRRRSIRLKEYDYSASGAYFVTLCAQGQLCVLGEITDAEVVLNDAGMMVAQEWESLPTRFPFVELDAFVVMPNHLHGVLLLGCSDEDCVRAESAGEDKLRPYGDHARRPSEHDVRPNEIHLERPGEHEVRPYATHPKSANGREARLRGTAARSLGRVMQGFKSVTTVAYVAGVRSQGWSRFEGRVWQRNYHDHVVRSEKDLTRIRDYMAGNPARWSDDEYNPDNAP